MVLQVEIIRLIRFEIIRETSKSLSSFFSNEARANDLNAASLEFPPRVRSLRCSHATGTNRSVVDSSPIINFGRRECSGNSHSSFPFPFAVLEKKRSVAREEMCPLDARNLSLVAFFFDVLR